MAGVTLTDEEPSVFRLSRPCPSGDLADRMQLVNRAGVRVLLGHAGAELDVLAHGHAESVVVGKASFIDRFEVEGDEPFPLLVGDL